MPLEATHWIFKIELQKCLTIQVLLDKKKYIFCYPVFSSKTVNYQDVIDSEVLLDWWWKYIDGQTPLKLPKISCLFSHYVCTWISNSLNTGSLSESLKLTELMPVKNRENPFDNDKFW